MEEDKERLNNQLDKMLQSYKQLEQSHIQVVNMQSEYEDFKSKSQMD